MLMIYWFRIFSEDFASPPKVFGVVLAKINNHFEFPTCISSNRIIWPVTISLWFFYMKLHFIFYMKLSIHERKRSVATAFLWLKAWIILWPLKSWRKLWVFLYPHMRGLSALPLSQSPGVCFLPIIEFS